jgi:hypothetical protein
LSRMDSQLLTCSLRRHAEDDISQPPPTLLNTCLSWLIFEIYITRALACACFSHVHKTHKIITKFCAHFEGHSVSHAHTCACGTSRSVLEYNSPRVTAAPYVCLHVDYRKQRRATSRPDKYSSMYMILFNFNPYHSEHPSTFKLQLYSNHIFLLFFL